MLKIQQYLREGGTLAKLTEDYAISVKRHAKYNNLCHFSYHQFLSPMGELLVQQCRGLILDESNNWEIVGHPFPKFFNYLEPNAATIDWSTARVQEKCDGSMIAAFCYKDEWLVSTTGTADASGPVNDLGYTFEQLFWDSHENLFGSRQIINGHKDHTYVFELMTPHNRVIVPHKEPKIVLITLRRNADGFEYVDYMNYVYPRPKTFPLGNINLILDSLKDINPLEQEGYVVVDGKSQRIKVKHPQYVAMSHIKSGMSLKNLVAICLKGEFDEILTAFPEWKPAMDHVTEALNDWTQAIVAKYEELKGIESQKDFALEAVKTNFSNYLFLMRKGKDLRVLITETQPEKLVDSLKLDKDVLKKLVFKNEEANEPGNL